MFSVFRITRAEFAKVFKKPTVYIMAFVLALAIVVSMFIYSPINRPKTNITLTGDSSETYYSSFMGSDINSETKNKIDATYFTSVDNKLQFYIDEYERSTNLNEELNLLKANFQTLKKTYATGNASDVNKLFDKTKANFNNILSLFNDDEDTSQAGDEFSIFSNYDELKAILDITLATDANVKIYENKSFDVSSTTHNYTITTLKNTYIPSLTSMSDIATFVQTVETNKYLTIMENVVNYTENIIFNVLHDIIKQIEQTQTSFIDLVSHFSLTDATKERILAEITSLNNQVITFKSLIDGLTNSNTFVINTNTNYKSLTNAYNDFREIYEKVDTSSSAEYNTKKDAAIKLQDSNYLHSFKNYLNNLTFIKANKDFNKTLNEYKDLAEDNKTAILSSIEKKKADISSTELIKEIKNYKLLGITYKNVTDCLIVKHLLNSVSYEELQDAKNWKLEDLNTYQNDSDITIYTYQMEENIYNLDDMGRVFSLNQTSGTKTNMYDFVYFALKIATILIIVFTIMMIANIITSETESETIKLLLIRPYSRSTILWGKIFATFFFSLIFMLFATIASFVAGYLMFGAPLYSSILVSFNATTAFSISPIVLILLYLLSCISDIVFYLIIALMVSVLFRSYIGAISTSLLIYIGALVLGAYLSGSAVYAFLPFTNVCLFRYFGGEILAKEASGIGVLLGSPIHSLQNFWLSFGLTTGFSIIMLIITFISFKRRDF